MSEEIPHDYRSNGLGGEICQRCGHWMQNPDWPQFCAGGKTGTQALSTSTSSGIEADTKPSGTLEDNIRQLLNLDHDISAKEREHRESQLQALLSLYQKELEKTLNKIAAADDFYGPRLIELAGFKLTGEQP